MPGQRAAGKKKIGVWVTDDENAALNEALKRLGFSNLADYLRHIAEADANQRPTSLSEVKPKKTRAKK